MLTVVLFCNSDIRHIRHLRRHRQSPAGVYFPVTILPEGLRKIADWLPFTYALEAVRTSLIQGVFLGEISQDLLVLSGFSVLILPLGLAFFRRAFNQSRLYGTLGFN